MQRSRLLEQLTKASALAGPPMPTLVCAPAGYGKTKLVTAWLAQFSEERIIRFRCYPGADRTLWLDLLREVAPDRATAIEDARRTSSPARSTAHPERATHT